MKMTDEEREEVMREVERRRKQDRIDRLVFWEEHKTGLIIGGIILVLMLLWSIPVYIDALS